MQDECFPSEAEQSFVPFFWPVFLVTMVFFCNFMARLIVPPFLVPLENEFGLSHVQAGGLLLVTSVGISFSLLASGFVAKGLTHRRTIALSSLGVGVCMLLIARAEALGELKLLLVLLGLAIGLYLPSGVSIITSLVPSRHWGKGLAVHEVAPNVSFIAAPAVAAAVEGVLSWRQVFQGLGIAGIGMGLVFVLIGQGGRFAGESPRPAVITAIVRRPQFWLLALLFGLAVGTTFGIFSMLPLYLVKDHGLNPAWANKLVSLSRLPCLCMAFGSGLIVDRIGPKRTIFAALTISGACTVLLGLFSGFALQAAVLVQPLWAVSFFPAAFASISRIFDFRIRNVAISFIVPMAVLAGTGLIPTGLGWFGDMGHFSWGFVLLGGMVMAGGPLVACIRLERSGEEVPCS